MTAYAAFLRGVSPMNCRMPALKRAFEGAGFREVRTILSSGNVLFESRALSTASLERKAQAAMREALDQEFFTIVRSVESLRALIASDPYRGLRVAPAAKRVVTFLRKPPAEDLDLPIERDGARVMRLTGTNLFSAYVASEKGPVFMTLIEKAVGKEQTTRTWQTVERMARS